LLVFGSGCYRQGGQRDACSSSTAHRCCCVYRSTCRSTYPSPYASRDFRSHFDFDSDSNSNATAYSYICACCGFDTCSIANPVADVNPKPDTYTDRNTCI
jgi:hypothetical protein